MRDVVRKSVGIKQRVEVWLLRRFNLMLLINAKGLLQLDSLSIVGEEKKPVFCHQTVIPIVLEAAAREWPLSAQTDNFSFLASPCLKIKKNIY